MYTRPYGITCPVLNIARTFSEDYGKCLRLADYLIHGRGDMRNLATMNSEAMSAVIEWAREYNRIRKGIVSI